MMARFRNPYGCAMVEEIDEHLEIARRADDEDEALDELAFFLLNYEKSLFEPETSLCQRGISGPGRKLDIAGKARNRKASDIFAPVLSYWRREYDEAARGTDHRLRRKKLEEIIRFLLPRENSESPELVNLLARVYLNRSLLYRPKGFTVPARKIEALKKSMRLAETVMDMDDSNVEALRTYGIAALELLRCGEDAPDRFEDFLENAVLYITEKGIEAPTDISILLKYVEIHGDGSPLELIPNEDRDWGRPFDLKLFQARAAVLLGRENEAGQLIRECLDAPPKALSDPFWDDLVDFIDSAKRQGMDSVWKSAAMKAQKKCAAREAKIGNNIYLSWHWSRRQPLYDLAFAACETVSEQAEIADSLKSRPTLRYKALAHLEGKNEFIGEFLRQEYEARDNRYLRRKPEQVRIDRKDIVDFDRLPAEWIAVHFYLNQSEETGYALMHDATVNQWRRKTFSFSALFEKFLEWQESYSIGELREATSALAGLCREMGESLSFLFDEAIFPKNRPVLFVPHGFLHHLPLHAAVGSGDAVFLENHVCRYLPAWHLLPRVPNVPEGERVLVIHFPPDDPTETFSDLASRDKEWSYRKDDAGARDLKDALRSPPALLVILCHGEGDILNPFRSRLKLHGGDMTLMELLESMPDMSGARVLLGACESDMAPPQGYPVDEHLSLGSLFLSQGAGEVIAGLWEIATDKVNELYETFCEMDEDMAERLNAWQMEYISEQKENSFLDAEEGRRDFYEVVSFRIMGLPV
jgi:hypothetical protein